MIVQNKVLGLIGLSTKAGKLLAGREVVLENVRKKKVNLVICAEDASDKTKKEIKEICDKFNIKLIEFQTIEELSKTIGKENKAIIGIKDKNLSTEIENKIYGGDANGEN